MVDREPAFSGQSRAKLAARALRLSAASLLLVLTGGPAVIAEGEVFLRYPHLDPGMRSPARAERPRERVSRPRVQQQRPDIDVTARKVEPAFFVTVLGDSLAAMLGDGVKDVFADRPDLAVQRRTRDSSGLVRDDFHDWIKTARDLMASGERIDHVVILLGSNDRQSLRDGAATAEPFTPRWKELYGQRVETLVGVFRERKLPVTWVGLPIMRGDRLSADAVQLNELFRIHAEKAGARFVDVFEKFADETGQYNAAGPDVSGQTARLRTADGVHFTRAGAAKLAHFVESDLRETLANLAPKQAPQNTAATSGGDALIDPATLDTTRIVLDAIRRESEERILRETLPGLSAPDLPLQPFLPPQRPAAGPVQQLTATLAAPGGELARRSPRAAQTVGAQDPQSLIARQLVEGRAAEPRPGRADDFAWPRR